MTGKTLTKRQREFAEENHEVLLGFLRERGLSMAEYYDIVVFPFLDAVRMCDWERDDFPSMAQRCMSRELERYFSRRKKEKRMVEILSLDYVVSQKDNLLLSDVIADKTVDFVSDVCRKLSRPKGYRLLHIPQSTLRSVRLANVGGGICSGF